MSEDHTSSSQRRLGVVLFADVVGYGRLMGEDEVVTQEAVNRYLERFETECGKLGGDVVEERGDGVFALFESAGSAVQFAVEMQRAVEEDNDARSEDRRIRFRIGIHLGEVMRDARGVHGESVVIAARLQALANPGQVYISAVVYEQVRNKLRYGYEYLGPQLLKNLRDPVPVYCVRTAVEGVVMAPSLRGREHGSDRERPEGPSVAVLPFENRGADASEDWFAEGITEDITLNLSRFKNLFVIARNSAFVLKAKAVRPQEAARELGVRYITRGSVRRAGTRVRIAVELIDTDTERTIWGERYDRDLGDIFALQDEVSETIVAATAVQIEANERQRLRQGMPSNLAAYSYVLQGQQHLFRYTRRDNAEAHGLYEKALDADPDYARAWAALSRTVNLGWRYSWSGESDDALDTALAHAKSAVQLDPTDARGFGELGFVHLWRKEHETAISNYERALALNPNDADVMSEMADAFVFSGRPVEAVALLERAMRLNPFYPDEYLWNLAGAYYDLKEYEKAIESVLKMNNPTEGQRVLAASYAMLGRMEEARREAARHKAAHPEFSLDRWSQVVPDKLESHAEHFYEGLKKAGF
ncbi:MAG TPA: tetratricopeptide repeat protein [Thermohalobaculum sp.]|nr:tetratricopeptide repeat protein [Thermohalobaculum sp.]